MSDMNCVFKAGAGKAGLCFPVGYYPSDGYAGEHDSMHVRVLLLEKGELRGGIVSFDLPSIRPWELTDALRAYVAEKLEAPYENVWLAMTHDLSAPHVPKDSDKRRLHMDTLYAAAGEAAAQAKAALRPASVCYAEGSSDVNANRDMESIDGWWVGIHGKGPSDKTLSLLRFDDAEGKPLAVLFSYALKPSVLEAAEMSDGNRYASGDLSGCASRKAEEVIGCPVLFVMGAAGDQVPKVKASYLELDENRKFYTIDLREKGYEALEELSDTLSRDIIATAKSAEERNTDPALHFLNVHVDMKGKKTYSKELITPPVLSYEYEADEQKTLDIFSMRIGDAAILGLKPEVTTPVFAAIKAASPFVHSMMATLVNGGQGYIASDFDYERFTYPGMNTPFAKGEDAKFIDEAVKVLKELY